MVILELFVIDRIIGLIRDFLNRLGCSSIFNTFDIKELYYEYKNLNEAMKHRRPTNRKLDLVSNRI